MKIIFYIFCCSLMKLGRERSILLNPFKLHSKDARLVVLHSWKGKRMIQKIKRFANCIKEHEFWISFIVTPRARARAETKQEMAMKAFSQIVCKLILSINRTSHAVFPLNGLKFGDSFHYARKTTRNDSIESSQREKFFLQQT